MSTGKKIRSFFQALDDLDFPKAMEKLDVLPKDVFEESDELLFYLSGAYSDDDEYLNYVNMAIPYMRNVEDLFSLVTLDLNEDDVHEIFRNELFETPKRLFRKLKETNFDLKPIIDFFKRNKDELNEWLDETESWKEFANFLLEECS